MAFGDAFTWVLPSAHRHAICIDIDLARSLHEGYSQQLCRTQPVSERAKPAVW